MNIKEESLMILSGFIEEQWVLFAAYLEEHGEDSDKADEIIEELRG